MTLLRNLVADLVEKRLWPVAVVLVAAMAATPLLLGGGADPADVPVAVAPVTGTAGTVTAEDVKAVGPAGRRTRPGRLRNPFTPHHGASASAKDVVSSLKGSSVGKAVDSLKDPTGSGSGSGSPPSDTTITSTTPTTTTTTTTATTGGDDAEPGAKVRFVKVADGAEERAGDFAELGVLDPLPFEQDDDPSDAYLVLVGVHDGEATFLLADGVSPEFGDGDCAPADDDCQTLTLGEGDSEFLDVTNSADASSPLRYELDVRSVTGEAKADPDEAQKAVGRDAKAHSSQAPVAHIAAPTATPLGGR